MSASNHTDVRFDCNYYADGRPVTVEDGPYYHVLTKKIDIDFTADVIKDNLGALADARLMLVLCRRTDEWQLVAVHESDGTHASRLNRAVATIARDCAIDRLLREHTSAHKDGYTRKHKARWGVNGFDQKTGRVSAWLADAGRDGLPYGTIRAAEVVLEEQGINA